MLLCFYSETFIRQKKTKQETLLLRYGVKTAPLQRMSLLLLCFSDKITCVKPVTSLFGCNEAKILAIFICIAFDFSSFFYPVNFLFPETTRNTHVFEHFFFLVAMKRRPPWRTNGHLNKIVLRKELL